MTLFWWLIQLIFLDHLTFIQLIFMDRFTAVNYFKNSPNKDRIIPFGAGRRKKKKTKLN
jgi:hypothetical protein